MRVVIAFNVRRLPTSVDRAWTTPSGNGVAPERTPDCQPAPTRA
jgi:hypothetical protein